MEYFLIGLVMSVLVAAMLGLIVGYSLLMERLAARRPKSENALQVEAPEKEATQQAPSIAARALSSIMSRAADSATPQETPGNGVAGNAPEAGQPIAKPGNAVNDGLPGNMLPEEVREIMRFQAKVEAVEAILKAGKIGQVEAIETIFACKRSGRPESAYARAVAALKARSTAEYRERQARLVELITAQDEGAS